MSKNHTHQYKKVKQKPSGRIIWRCMLTNCNHYITDEFILGKASICPSCEREFIIDRLARTRMFPKCQDCRGRNESSTPTSTSQRESVNSAVSILKKYGIQ